MINEVATKVKIYLYIIDEFFNLNVTINFFRTSMSKAKLKQLELELRRLRPGARTDKVMREKETFPVWNKKYATNTIEVGVVIDKALYQWMAVSICKK